VTPQACKAIRARVIRIMCMVIAHKGLRPLRRRGDGGRQRRPEAVLAVQGRGVLRRGVPGCALEGWRAQGGINLDLTRFSISQGGMQGYM